MVFEILRGTGRDPSLLTGGNLVSLQEEGYLGNAWTGSSDLLVIEADESDGSLVRYAPWVGVLLNLRLDHKPLTELADLFTAFRAQTRKRFLVGEDEALGQFAENATMFGVEQRSDVRAENVRTQRDGSSFTVAGVPFTLPLPGEYNVLNAVAAVAACQAAGIPVSEMPGVLAGFRGVTRRFQVLGSVGGIEVIDDFAHNPDKIGAALRAAHTRGERVLAVFQPHGFGPTRFLRDALIDIFAVNLRPQDRLTMPEIFYAGGTVTRDISSRDITSAVTARDRQADFVAARSNIPALLAAEARSGDVILVMGARDPSLTDFCQAILDTLRHRDR
jgi:UDP-N-acetylmuramate--alanine ligase